MQVTVIEIQDLMQGFYRQNQRLPNTILLPAIEQAQGLDTARLEHLFCVKIIFAAIQQPQAAII